MSDLWVLVADSSSAKIFKADDVSDQLQEVIDLIHSESRMHEQQITSDLPGSNAGSGGSRHGFEGQTGIKEQEAVNFAREINAKLEAGRNNGEFNRLVIAAAPAFLGVLRQTINENTAKLVIQELDRDLVKFSASEIRDHIFSAV